MIERSTRRVLVTAAGERLLPQAMAILEAADRFVAAAAVRRAPSPVRCASGMIPTVAPYVLPGLLPEFAVHVPESRSARGRGPDRAPTASACARARSTSPCSRCPPNDSGMVEIPLYQ